MNAMTTLRTSGNRVGGSYTFNYDIGRATLLTSRIVGYYNAQCCGVAVEYQTVNFPQSSAYPVPPGQPVQHLVHAGGARHLLEFLRRAGRRRGKRGTERP